MTALFALIVCLHYHAPFYVFVIGALCLMLG
jgi:hypothetical protein